MNKKNIIITVLRITTILLIVLPHGSISQILEVKIRQERNLKLSPYKEICHLCNRPAMHKQGYSSSSHIGRDYFFCDKHYPVPEKIKSIKERSGKVINPFAAIFLVVILYLFQTIRSIIYFIKKDDSLKPSIGGAISGFTIAIGIILYFRTL
jgi:hypothetical protein